MEHEHRLLLQAYDIGEPPLAAYALVTVQVRDVNDCPPLVTVTTAHPDNKPTVILLTITFMYTAPSTDTVSEMGRMAELSLAVGSSAHTCQLPSTSRDPPVLPGTLKYFQGPSSTSRDPPVLPGTLKYFQGPSSTSRDPPVLPGTLQYFQGPACILEQFRVKLSTGLPMFS